MKQRIEHLEIQFFQGIEIVNMDHDILKQKLKYSMTTVQLNLIKQWKLRVK